MATKSERHIFLDTNILVRSTVLEAPFHKESLEAIRILTKKQVRLWISQQVLREYMSVVTREQPDMKPLPMKVAVSRARYFQAHFDMAQDNSLILYRLFNLLETVSVAGKQVHDTNIVATMMNYGISELLTLNIGHFTRFSSHIKVLSLHDVI